MDHITTCITGKYFWNIKYIKDQRITGMISDKTWLKRGSSLPGGVGRVLHNLCYKVRHQVVQYSSKQGFCVLADCRMCDRTLRPPCSCNYLVFFFTETPRVRISSCIWGYLLAI